MSSSYSLSPGPKIHTDNKAEYQFLLYAVRTTATLYHRAYAIEDQNAAAICSGAAREMEKCGPHRAALAKGGKQIGETYIKESRENSNDDIERVRVAVTA